MKFSIANLMVVTTIVAYFFFLMTRLEQKWYQAGINTALLIVLFDGGRFWLASRSKLNTQMERVWWWLAPFFLGSLFTAYVATCFIPHLYPMFFPEWKKLANEGFRGWYAFDSLFESALRISLYLGCIATMLALRPRSERLPLSRRRLTLDTLVVCAFFVYFLHEYMVLSGLVHLALDGIIRSWPHIQGDPWDLAGANWPHGWRNIFIAAMFSAAFIPGAIYAIHRLVDATSPRERWWLWFYVAVASITHVIVFAWIWRFGTLQLNPLWKIPGNAVTQPRSIVLAFLVAIPSAVFGADCLLRSRSSQLSTATSIPYQAWSARLWFRSLLFVSAAAWLIQYLLADFLNGSGPVAWKQIFYRYVYELIQFDKDVLWCNLFMLIAFHGYSRRTSREAPLISLAPYSVGEWLGLSLAIFGAIFLAIPSLMFAGIAIWMVGFLN